LPNIFNLPRDLAQQKEEVIEVLASGEHVVIERILSSGHRCAPGFWYDQSQDEWVVLLQGQAQITFTDGEVCQLQRGDSLFIPAHRQHRVETTSIDPPCIWIAVHGRMQVASQGITAASLGAR
jgi:cupin 2 domain-containing protein